MSAAECAPGRRTSGAASRSEFANHATASSYLFYSTAAGIRIGARVATAFAGQPMEREFASTLLRMLFIVHSCRNWIKISHHWQFSARPLQSAQRTGHPMYLGFDG